MAITTLQYFMAVASMGQGGQLFPPRYECSPPPDGFCPITYKPVFGNGANASQDYSLKIKEAVKANLNY